MTKTALMAVGGAAVLWAGTAFLLWRFQEKMLFFPRPTPPAITQLFSHWKVEVKANDGKILRGWEHPGDENAPKTDCALLIYFGGNSEEVSTHLIDNGKRFSCPQWYVNYRGFGDSEGSPSAEQLRSDALNIADEAIAKLGGNGEICVMGRSLGTHMAAHVAANRPVKKLIMTTPFDSVLNVAKRRYPIFPVRAMLRHPFDTSAEAPNVSAPTLFLLAESDRVVPIQHSEKLIADWQAPHTVHRLYETSHNSMETHEYWQAIAEFMAPQNNDR